MLLLVLLKELCLVVFLVVDLYEAWESGLWCHAAVPFKDVDHDAIGSLLDSLPCKSCLLFETTLVANVGFVTEIVDAVKELAPLAIHAVSFIMVLAAHLCFVVRRKVLLGHEFVHVVGIGASIAVFAVMIHKDIPAHLRFLHLLYFLVELEAFLAIHELFLLCCSRCLSSEARDIVEVVAVLMLKGRESRVHLRHPNVMVVLMMMMM